MCRLFGLVANKKVNVSFSFEKADIPFQSLGKSNPDGWGIGYYDMQGLKVFKEPINIQNSNEVEKIAKDVESNIIIAHVRKASKGSKKKENTHPFSYKNWVFAHNGTVYKKDELKEKLKPEYKQKIKGETDSEVLFYWVLQNINDEGGDPIKGIKKAVSNIKSKEEASSLNFILSDGNNMYVLRKAFKNIDYYSLYFLNRNPENKNTTKFKSNETKMLIKSKASNKEKAVIVCSEKLTNDENWQCINNNELLIITKELEIKRDEL